MNIEVTIQIIDERTIDKLKGFALHGSDEFMPPPKATESY